MMTQTSVKMCDVITAILAAMLVGVVTGQAPNVTVTRLDTSIVMLSWTAPDNDSYTGYTISFQGAGVSYITNQPIPKTASSYVVEGLKSSTDYKICVTGVKTPPHDVTCINTRTIDPMRIDGIIAMLVVIGYVLICVLIGWCWWRHKKASHGLEKGHGSRDLAAASYNNDIEEDDNSLGRYRKRSSMTRNDLGRTSL